MSVDGGFTISSWGGLSSDGVESQQALAEIDATAEQLRVRLRLMLEKLRQLETHWPPVAAADGIHRAALVAGDYVLRDLTILDTALRSLESQIRERVRDLADRVPDVHERDVHGVGLAEALSGDVPEQDVRVAGSFVDGVDPSHDSPSVETRDVLSHAAQVGDTVGGHPDTAAGTPSRAVSGTEIRIEHFHAPAGMSLLEIDDWLARRRRASP